MSDRIWDLSRVIFGMVLYAAATLKLLSAEGVPHGATYVRIVTLPAFEVALGTLLILTRDARAWWLGAMTLFAFLVYSIYNYFTGQECGCFGDYTPPGLTVWIDLLLFSAFVISFHDASATSDPNFFRGGSVSCGLGIVVFTTAWIGIVTPYDSNVTGRPVWSNETVAGKQLIELIPQLEASEIQDVTRHVFLLQVECGRCQRIYQSIMNSSDPEAAMIIWQQDGSWWTERSSFDPLDRARITWKAGAEPYFIVPMRLTTTNGIVVSVLAGTELEEEMLNDA